MRSAVCVYFAVELLGDFSWVLEVTKSSLVAILGSNAGNRTTNNDKPIPMDVAECRN